MTLIATDLSTREHHYVVQTDFDMDRDISHAGYLAWLEENGLEDEDGSRLFNRYQDERIKEHYLSREPVKWLAEHGIEHRLGSGMKDATHQPSGNDFVGVVVVVPNEDDAKRFEARWMEG